LIDLLDEEQFLFLNELLNMLSLLCLLFVIVKFLIGVLVVFGLLTFTLDLDFDLLVAIDFLGLDYLLIYYALTLIEFPILSY
jgi:hypothetical protein